MPWKSRDNCLIPSIEVPRLEISSCGPRARRALKSCWLVQIKSLVSLFEARPGNFFILYAPRAGAGEDIYVGGNGEKVLRLGSRYPELVLCRLVLSAPQISFRFARQLFSFPSLNTTHPFIRRSSLTWSYPIPNSFGSLHSMPPPKKLGPDIQNYQNARANP